MPFDPEQYLMATSASAGSLSVVGESDEQKEFREFQEFKRFKRMMELQQHVISLYITTFRFFYSSF